MLAQAERRFFSLAQVACSLELYRVLPLERPDTFGHFRGAVVSLAQGLRFLPIVAGAILDAF